MTMSPLFDETGQHCLRSVQTHEEGLQFVQKIEEGILKSVALADLLKLVIALEIPITQVINMIGEARVVFQE